MHCNHPPEKLRVTRVRLCEAAIPLQADGSQMSKCEKAPDGTSGEANQDAVTRLQQLDKMEATARTLSLR